MLRLDAVEWREGAAEDVVEPAELARPLDRDEVDRLLDDADEGVVTARIAADRAHLVLGEVSAFLAEADPLLHVLDRRREREGLVLRPLQQVEGEAMSGTRSHTGQARKLRDEVFHSGAQHLPYCADMPRTAEAPRPTGLAFEDTARV